MKATLRVIKRDGRQEDYDRPKLKTAIENACIKRSIPAQRIENLLMEVETEITQEYEWEVPSTTIGRKVAEKLAKLDEVAYLRYISIYRRFHDASQFLSEIENLIERQ